MSEKQPELTPKEALAILYQLNAAVGWHLYLSEATVEEQALREQIWAAFYALRLANPFVVLKDDPGIHKSPCTACLERLKAEGKIARIENWETGEVTLC